MTYGVKRSRVLIEQHAPWFSLANYKKLIGASPLTWYLQFASRIDLHRMRSLLLGPHQSFLPAFSSAHASLTELIRRVGVLDGESLELFMEGENFISPESFSAIHAVSVQGLHVRLMTVGDLLHATKTLDDELAQKAIMEHDRSPFELHSRARSRTNESSALCQPVSKLKQTSVLETSELFVTVDTRLPPALIGKQVIELVDQFTRLHRGSSIYPKQTKVPAFAAWRRSRVLPYIDLCQWLHEPGNEVLRAKVSDADLAAALDVDPKQLSDTTKAHAQQLTDEFNLTFVQLQEAAISVLRGPKTALRLPKRSPTFSAKD